MWLFNTSIKRKKTAATIVEVSFNKDFVNLIKVLLIELDPSSTQKFHQNMQIRGFPFQEQDEGR